MSQLKGRRNSILIHRKVRIIHRLLNIKIGQVTLVFELFDILVKLIDPRVDAMDLSDDTIKCFHVCQKQPPQIVSLISFLLYIYLGFYEV